jgi:hypothetical protein
MKAGEALAKPHPPTHHHPPPPSFSSSSSSEIFFSLFGSSLLYPLRKGVAWLGQSARWQHWLYIEKKELGGEKWEESAIVLVFFPLLPTQFLSTLLQVKRVGWEAAIETLSFFE